VHRIDDAPGTAVSCVSGVVWVTQERDSRDLVLGAGQSVVLDRPGLAVVYALRDALVTVGASPQPPEHKGLPPAARAHVNRAWA
jgi:DUF2917 family protein